MDGELISVVVPSYNVAQWLPRSLDSLLAQTYPNLEILVVDDGSRDETQAVARSYASRHANIRLICKENGGVTSARLRGASEAAGSWIGFMDADDTVDPDMYQRLMDNACACGGDISHCGHRVLFPDGRVSYVHNSGLRQIQDNLTGQRDLLDGGQIESSLCTKLFRRELFDGLEAWMDPSITINEDFMMNFYLFSRANVSIYEDFCPYCYILRSGSASYRVLHEHSIFDPIQVRMKILEACRPEIREDARRALLRNLLFAYAQLSVNHERRYDGFRQRVRAMLQEQRPWFDVLSARNRVLARMVCAVPWMFSLAYCGYVKIFQKEEQH